MSGEKPIVLLDLDGMLGYERIGSDGSRFENYFPFSETRDSLLPLRERARFGVASFDSELDADTINEGLSRTRRLGDLIDLGLTLAVDPASKPGTLPLLPDSILVSRDVTGRGLVLQSGGRAIPHVRLLAPLLDGEPLVFARAEAREAGPNFPWAALIGERPIVPVHIASEPWPTLYAAASRSALEPLAAATEVLLLESQCDLVAETMLALIQVRSDELGRFEEGRDYLRWLGSLPFARETVHGFVAALRASERYQQPHPPRAAHGHSVELGAATSLLQAASPLAGGLQSRPLSAGEKTALAAIDGATICQLVDELSGKASVSDGVNTITLKSRHTDHPHNAFVTGWIRSALAQICPHAWSTKAENASDGTPRFNVIGEIPGSEAELVIVAAHLDSIAAGSQPESGDAPGADDDASGTAGVIAAAKVLSDLAQVMSPTRTLQFVLFNQEEQFRKGSLRYANDLKSEGVPVAAMIMLDMIGWRSPSEQQAIFEIHGCGPKDYYSASAPSRELTNVVADATAQVSPGLLAERYPTPAPNYCPWDPAAMRSDHSSFHAQGWAACLLCEDLFEGECLQYQQAGNPQYHTSADTEIDCAFAADIARAAAAAAWMLATPGSGPPASGTTPEGDETSTAIAFAPQPRVLANSGPTGAFSGSSNGGSGMTNKYIVEFLAKWIRDEEFRCKVLKEEQTTLKQEGYTTAQIDTLFRLDKWEIICLLIQELEGLGIDLKELRQTVHDLPSSPIGCAADDLPPCGCCDGLCGCGCHAKKPAPIPDPRFALAPTTGGALRQGQVVLADPRMAGPPYLYTTMLALSSALIYGEGQVHLRSTDPEAVAEDDERVITVRGHGFDPITGGKKPDVHFVFEDTPTGTPKTIPGKVKDVTCDVDVYQRVEVKVKLDEKGIWKIIARNDGDPQWSDPITITVL